MEFSLSAVAVLVLQCFVLCELKNVMDLTWSFGNDTIYWTGVRPFSYIKRLEGITKGYWYSANEFCCGEHGGTHLDAPYHFYRFGWKVADIPLDRLIVKGALLDLQEENRNGITNLEVRHLEKWEKENGPFSNGIVLLVKFGRSEYWLNSTKYFELDHQNNYNFPGVSKPAAEWLANSGKFYGVGLDTPSVDPGSSSDFTTHRILNGKQIYIMENVKLIEELPAKGFTLLVMPMKLEEGSGAPLRLMAVLSESIQI